MLKFITDYFWLFFLAGIIAGIFLPAAAVLSPFVMYILMFVLFLSCLKMDMGNILTRIKDYKLVVYLVVIILVITPIVVYLIFKGFLEPEYALGFLLIAAMPSGMVTPVYATIFKADKELALVIVTITSLLCPITVPLIIYFLTGVETDFDVFGMFIKLCIIIFIPFALSILFRKIGKGIIKKTEEYYSPVSVLLIVLIISGALADANVLSFVGDFRSILSPFLLLFVLAALLHIAGYFAVFKRDTKTRAVSSIEIAYMNFTLALVVGQEFFGDKTVFIAALYQIHANIALITFIYIFKKFLHKGIKA
ncbi:MAG: hypothetical protein GY861_24945 [bacterium]|nr:hypothetical protein [bacterium]